jgi:hypothetical protein
MTILIIGTLFHTLQDNPETATAEIETTVGT